MKKIKIVLILLTVVLLSASSCTKEHSEKECMGGTPGNLTIKVYLQHHEHTLINLKNYRDTIYVKYNAQDYAGSEPANYDTTYIGEYPDDNVRLTNLRCGNYYLYAVGMESTHFTRVLGGIPFSTELKEGEVSVTIPVAD